MEEVNGSTPLCSTRLRPPGYDLRPIPGKQGEMAYGLLPPRLFDQIRSGILDIILGARGNITPRD